MRAKLRASLVLLLAAGALPGCSRNNALTTDPLSGSTSAQTQIVSQLTLQPGVIEDGLSDSQVEVDASLTTGTGLAAIHPLTFRRLFRVHDRTFEFAYSDSDSTGQPTRAVVTIRTHLVGTFNILAGIPGTDGTDMDSTRRVIRKPLDETRVRRVLLRRAPMPADVPDDADVDHDGHAVRWRIAAVSGVKVSSRDHTTEVLSLRVQSGALDTTITDPLAFIRLRGVLKFEPGNTVTLTVTTGRNDDVMIFHHNDRRFRLHNNGDNTYTGVFRTGLFARGLWHFGVDAISHGTLFDDQAAYDSQRWVFPYVFAPERLDGPAL